MLLLKKVGCNPLFLMKMGAITVTSDMISPFSLSFSLFSSPPSPPLLFAKFNNMHFTFIREVTLNTLSLSLSLFLSLLFSIPQPLFRVAQYV